MPSGQSRAVSDSLAVVNSATFNAYQKVGLASQLRFKAEAGKELRFTHCIGITGK